MNFRHIILTRFNLQFDSKSDIHIQEAWLNERIRLFQQYCLPAMEQQTTQNFIWVILASDQTPAYAKKILLDSTQGQTHFHVRFCAYTADLNAMYKTIGEEYAIGYDHLLSTRMDNDDMIAANFVEELQAHLGEPKNEFKVYTFPHGLQLFETQKQVFGIYFEKNHFSSFLEPTSNIHTSLGLDHKKVSSKQLVKLKEKSIWCEIVHSTNVCNNYTPQHAYTTRIERFLYPIPLAPYTPDIVSRYIFLIKEHIRYRSRSIKRLIKRVFVYRAS